MQHSTSGATISAGNLQTTDYKGDIAYSVPNDMANLSLDASGNQITASNVQGRQRELVFDIEEKSAMDKYLSAKIDAQNKPTAQNIGLLSIPLVISVAKGNGSLTYSFTKFTIKKRAKTDDILASTDGNENASRVMYTISTVAEFVVSEGVFVPYA